MLPGARYLPFAPLLWFSREVALARGWSVLEVWDEYVDRREDPWRCVDGGLEAALARTIGARVLPVAEVADEPCRDVAGERGLPGIWLTPLLPELRRSRRGSSV